MENDPVRYEITLSADQKQIEKNFGASGIKDKTAMIYNGRSHALCEYQYAFKNFFKDELRNGKKLYTDMISGKKRDELVT